MSEETKKKIDEGLPVTYKVDDNEIKLSMSIVQDYIVGNDVKISMVEYKMFAELCKVRKLNPFLKEAYLIKYSSNKPAQIVVGKDVILKRAILHPKFDGREQGVITINKDGEEIYHNGTFYQSDKETLVGGWARVFRKDWKYPTYISVAFSEVAQTKSDGSLNSNWGSKGATMVEKVALVRALRETFVEELAGLIDADEAWNNEPRQAKQNIVNQEEPNDIIETEIIDKTQSLDDL